MSDNLRESDSLLRKAIRVATKRLELLAKTQWDCRAQLLLIERGLLDALVTREHVKFKTERLNLSNEKTEDILVDLKSMLECSYPDQYTWLIAAFRRELDSRAVEHP